MCLSNDSAARWSLVAALALAACSPQGGNDPLALLRDQRADDVLFLTQKSIPGAHMEALFQGRVVKDGNGCLRLDSPDPATVVWPYGFTLRAVDGALHVTDAAGVRRGTIGGAFRISGGEITALSALIVGDDAASTARERCPGRFWVAGEMVDSGS